MVSELRFGDLAPDIQRCAAEKMLGPTARAAGAVDRILSEAAVNPAVAATLTRHVGASEPSQTGGTAASIGAQVDAADASVAGGGVSGSTTGNGAVPSAGGAGGGVLPPAQDGGATTFAAPEGSVQSSPIAGTSPDEITRKLSAGEDLSDVAPGDVATAATAIVVGGAATAFIVNRLLNYFGQRGIPAPTALQVAAEEAGLTGEYIPAGARASSGIQLEAGGPRVQISGPETFNGNVQFAGQTAPQLPGGPSGALPNIPPAAPPPPVIPPAGGVPPTPEGDPRLLTGGGTGTPNPALLRQMEEGARIRANRANPMEMDPRMMQRGARLLF